MISSKSTIALIGNTRIAYREFGDRKNRSILFLHGYSFSGLVFEEVARKLADKFHLILLDLPGFGSSDDLKDHISYDSYSNCISQFIKIIIGKPVILIGHSLGGGIGLLLASSFPKLIDKLILVDSTIIPMNKPRVILMINRSIEICLQLTLSKGFFHAFFMLCISFVNIVKHPLFMWRSIELPNRIDLSSLLRNVQIPVVIMWAKKDMTLPVNNAIIIVNLLPNAKLIFAPPYLYHDWCVTHPQVFLDMLMPQIST